jgi:hypothetical protein
MTTQWTATFALTTVLLSCAGAVRAQVRATEADVRRFLSATLNGDTDRVTTTTAAPMAVVSLRVTAPQPSPRSDPETDALDTARWMYALARAAWMEGPALVKDEAENAYTKRRIAQLLRDGKRITTELEHDKSRLTKQLELIDRLYSPGSDSHRRAWAGEVERRAPRLEALTQAVGEVPRSIELLKARELAVNTDLEFRKSSKSSLEEPAEDVSSVVSVVAPSGAITADGAQPSAETQQRFTRAQEWAVRLGVQVPAGRR